MQTDVLNGPLDASNHDPDLSFWALRLRLFVLENWQAGAIYATAILSILVAHEFGHFLMARRYHIPASLPYFIPMPFSPIGTMGAVIAMDGRRADRKQMFDIGLAGPLAGLAVILPVLAIGIGHLQLVPRESALPLDLPLLVRGWLALTHADYRSGMVVTLESANPFFLAGWVGCVLTGLNMMPVGQLDGGHVTYSLFGRGAHWIARVVMVAIILACVFIPAYSHWIVMAGLVLLIGIHHPPTRDDSVPLGAARWAIGLASLSLPVLTFAPRLFF